MSGGISQSQKVMLGLKQPGKPFGYTGLLAPLSQTNGILFPYTPTIQMSHSANYGAFDITHGMYAPNYYVNTPAPVISLTAIFTSNTIDEAKYTIASLHFLKSLVKSDFGQQRRATAGTPPPICKFFAYGQVHAENTPVIVKNFGYTLTEDVDYVSIGVDSINEGLTDADGLDRTSDLPEQFNAGTEIIEDFDVTSNGTVSIPTQLLMQIELGVQMAPSNVRKEFNIKSFASGGSLLSKRGYI